MNVRLAVGLVVLSSALLSTAIPAEGAIFGRRGGAWNDQYYDTAWGMPLAVVVPPTARWQTDYSWGVGGTRISPVGAQFQPQYPGPESAYNQRDYMPAPPQPTDTQQMGDYYVRGPRHK